ncbi:MAG: molybdopterin-dependent oxidoreductase [Thermotaleaceae bacterium]
MNKEEIQFACPMDCFDVCSFIAEVEDGRVLRIRGNKEHPMTKGYGCSKGAQHLERLYHRDRLLHPKRKVGGKFKDISWEEALDEISFKLKEIREKYGSLAVLHYYDSGYGGMSKTVDKMFFNYYGGITVPRGSLCWGAGIAAQKYDFGESRGHHPKDHLNAKTIIIWGRNPYNTNIHLMEYLREAKKSGAQVILIDPIQTKSAEIASEYIGIRPGTDGALALAMAHILIAEELVDKKFIKNHVKGFEEFADSIKDFTPDKASKITGIDQDVICRLARDYGSNKPSCIILGYGIQRYTNGGNTVRCIDALGAITGNIGIAGGGVNYANKSIASYVGGEVEKSERAVKNQRSYSRTFLGKYIEEENDPPIKAIFVTKANPLVQGPDLNQTIKAFEKIEFKVVIDMFMTDTAKMADLVLPCTHVMEEDDFVCSSMFSPYLNYSKQVIKPRAGIIGEYEFFRLLAKKMEMVDYPDIEKDIFLQRALEPLTEAFQISYQNLKEDFYAISNRDIPWEEKQFTTPSGKYELYSDAAERDGLSPFPQYIPTKEGDEKYPLRLLTPHPKESLHSQHFVFRDEIPTVYVHEDTAQRYSLCSGECAEITSPKGHLTAKVVVDNHVGKDILMIYEGWWHKSGSVNFLIEAATSEMGEQAAYYDSYCSIEPK